MVSKAGCIGRRRYKFSKYGIHARARESADEEDRDAIEVSLRIWRECGWRVERSNLASARMRGRMARVRAVATARRACELDFSSDVTARQTNPIGQRGHEGHIRPRPPQYWSIARDGISNGSGSGSEVGRISYIYY